MASLGNDDRLGLVLGGGGIKLPLGEDSVIGCSHYQYGYPTDRWHAWPATHHHVGAAIEGGSTPAPLSREPCHGPTPRGPSDH